MPFSPFRDAMRYFDTEKNDSPTVVQLGVDEHWTYLGILTLGFLLSKYQQLSKRAFYLLAGHHKACTKKDQKAGSYARHAVKLIK